MPALCAASAASRRFRGDSRSSHVDSRRSDNEKGDIIVSIMPPKENLSAQVALRPASGKAFNPQTAITSENIADYLPAPETVEAARKGFAAAGFEVSNPVGMSFSITGPAGLFEKVFKVKLVADDRGGIKVTDGKGGDQTYELPVESLSNDLRQSVAAVTFSPPPDFGPTSY